MIKNYLNRLNNKIYKEVSYFELILFLIGFCFSTIFISLYFSLFITEPIFANIFWPILVYFDVNFGIIAAIALSKKWRYAWILLIIDAIIYGSGLIPSGAFALAFVNIVVAPLFLIISYFIWNNKHNLEQGKNYIVTKKMEKKEYIIMILVAIIFIGLSSYLITKYTDVNHLFYTLIVSFTASLVLVAMFLGSFRYREAFIFYLLSNLIKVPLFLWVLIYYWINGDGLMSVLSLLYLTLAIIYLINSFYGLFLWSRKCEVSNPS